MTPARGLLNTLRPLLESLWQCHNSLLGLQWKSSIADWCVGICLNWCAGIC